MIDVQCVCGRTYRVPSDKGGRKLQCKRCGTVQRIPDPRRDSAPLVVPFQVPGESSAEHEPGPGRMRAPDALPLDLKSPVRRCPSCGFQDEATVVVCVRCGYDWRTGRRLEDAHDAAARSTRHDAAEVAMAEAADLGRLAWVALSPLGLLVGPYVFARSLAVERRLRLLGRGGEATHASQHARMMAAAGAFVWLCVTLFGVAAASRVRGTDEPSRVATVCEERLERVGRTVRSRLGSRPYPPQGALSTALTALAEAGEGALRPIDLRCPLGRDLYPYGCRDEVILTAETAPDFILLWDQEGHRDGLGRSGYRALRADGAVERLADRAALEAALRRAPFPLAPEGEGSPAARPDGGPPGGVSSVSGDGDGGDGGDGGANARFLAFARDSDERDPRPDVLLPVDPGYFIDRVGVPADVFLQRALADAAPAVRSAAARMLARVELPERQKLELARPLTRSPERAVVLGGILALRQLGEAEWLPLAVSLAEAAGEAAEEALELIRLEAARDEASCRAVLEQAAAVRRRTEARGDDAIFRLPPDALPFVAALLAESAGRGGGARASAREITREATASLYSAGAPGAEAARELLSSPDPAARAAAFRVLELLREVGVVSLEDYLELVAAEASSALQAAALERLAERPGGPPPELLDWALDHLRGPAGEESGLLCRKLLARIGREPAGTPEHEQGLQLLVEDLTRPGDHDAVASELAATTRLLDARLDELLLASWSRFTDPDVRRRLLRAAPPRPHEPTLRLVLLGIEDRDESVRVEALRALHQTQAPVSDALRLETARVLGRRLVREQSAPGRRLLFALASGSTYCGPAEGPEHRCTPDVLRALRQLARAGDVDAIRCLGTHPSREVVELLLGLLGVVNHGVGIEVTLALGKLAGRTIQSQEAEVWRHHIIGADSERRLRETAASQQAELRRVRERALARLAQLQKQ